jgi:O-antigen ligase
MNAAAWARAAAEALCLVLVVTLPAIFNPFGGQPIDPIKASLLRSAAALIAASWLVSRLLRASPAADVAANPVVKAGLLVLWATSVSTWLSINPRMSFFGSYYRDMGWLTAAAGVVLLVVGTDFWSDARRRERVVTAILVGAIVAGAYALVQLVGRDPVPWRNLGGPASSFGSPTFFGGFLVLAAPCALYRVAVTGQVVASGDRGRSSYATYAGYLALLLILAALVTLTTIRGPLLGLVVEVLAFALVIARKLPARVRRLALAAAALFLVVTLALAVIAAGSAGLQGLARFVGAPRPGNNPVSSFISASDRLIVWSAALPLPLASPLRTLVGFGAEMQLPALQGAEAAARTTPDEGGQWDRAHNLFVDTWLTGGALGLGALLVLLATVARGLWRTVNEGTGREPLLAAAVLAGLVGHLVEVSFAFETVVTGTLFWVFVALGAALAQPRVATRRVATRPARPLAAAVGAAAGVLLAPVLWAPSIADNIYGRATRADQAGAAQTAALRAEVAASWAPWVEEMPRLAGLDWQAVGLQRDGVAGEQLLARAEGQLQEAVRRGPYDPFGHLRLARLYLAWARRGPLTRTADELLGEAEQACATALEDSPFLSRTWQGCAEVSRERGRADEAAMRTERARQLGAQT